MPTEEVLISEQEIILPKVLPETATEASIPGEKLLFLDLDHTLFLNPFWSYVFPKIARRVSRKCSVDPEEVLTAISSYSRTLLRTRSLEAYDWDVIAGKVLLENFHYRLETPLTDLVQEGIESSQLLDGALEALLEARALGWTLVAASQGYQKYQEPVLEYLGLSDLLHDARFLDTTRSLKRNRYFYGNIPKNSLVCVVGDKYIDDALYPENFSFTSIWYTGLYRDKTVKTHLAPSATIKNLLDLGKTLSLLEFTPFREITKEEACFVCQGAHRYQDDLCRLCLQVSWMQ